LSSTGNGRLDDLDETGQRGFWAMKRTSGDVVTDAAFRLLQS
jgi:predicted phage gp36 major capsid-like protein